MSSAHVIRVKKLYRHGLKCLHNWTVHRDLYISKGFELRAEFDAQKLVKNPSVVEKLVSDGEAKLVTYAHPSPYTRELPPAHPHACAAPVAGITTRPAPSPQFRPCPAAPSTSDTQTTTWDGVRRCATPQLLFPITLRPVPGSPARPEASPLAPLGLPLRPAQLSTPNTSTASSCCSCAPSRATSSELAATGACI